MVYKNYRVVFHVIEAHEVYVKACTENDAIRKAEKKISEGKGECIETVDIQLINVRSKEISSNHYKGLSGEYNGLTGECVPYKKSTSSI